MNCVSPRGCGKAVKQAGISHLFHGEAWRLEHTAKAIQVKPTTWNEENVGLRLGNHR